MFLYKKRMDSIRNAYKEECIDNERYETYHRHLIQGRVIVQRNGEQRLAKEDHAIQMNDLLAGAIRWNERRCVNRDVIQLQWMEQHGHCKGQEPCTIKQLTKKLSTCKSRWNT